MAVTAVITCASTGIANEEILITCTVANDTASAVIVSSIVPTVVITGTTADSIPVLLGTPPVGPNLPVTVAATTGSQVFQWPAIALSPQSGGTVSYTFGAQVTFTTGAVIVADTDACTVSAPAPYAALAAPTIGTATAVAGELSAVVTWTAPAQTPASPIQGYWIVGSTDAVAQKAASTATSLNVSGLTSGHSYTFTVYAFNGAGAGASSSASNSITAS